jgi:tRNASer (uridine44-2'-O)-methyltransferase
MQDIGIATFLMLLWKDTYGPETIPPDPAPVAAPNTPEAQAPSTPDAEPWRRWPRPPGGFIDVGCGNGLLTHILISEGYAGYGFDLRARTSWTHYPQATQSHLHVRALDPTAPTRVLPMKHHQQNLRDPISSSQPPDTGNNNDDDEEEEEANSTTYNGGSGSSHGCVEDPDVPLPTGCFLIGNHADELTPWMPPLATRYLASGYLSIPCCAWTFDARFDRSRDVPFCAVDTESLNLGGEGAAAAASSSSYSLYRVWLAALSVHCGWAVEVEMLRIPSTRNWAIVGEFESFSSLLTVE